MTTIYVLMFPDIDDCSPNQCQNSATCVDGVDSFSCTCAAGFDGDRCQNSKLCVRMAPVHLVISPTVL